MSIRATKYFTPLIVFCLAIAGFTYNGLYCYGPLIFAWIIVPIAELFFAPDPKNLSAAEEELIRKDSLYDGILYAIVFIHLFTLFYFLYRMKQDTLSITDTIGRVTSMGLLLGIFGINVGHELGHRGKPMEKWLARISLMTSLYIHFYIEHNKGHHKRVATHEDPATARLGETVYAFWFRSIIYSYRGAWNIANKETRKKGQQVFSMHNEMVSTQLLQLVFLLLIIILFGWKVTALYLISAWLGILLLETVNYIEHYGLQRKKLDAAHYERTQPVHSWNSDHILGRLLLFELSRHSDHHYMASRKFQVLRHHQSAPQMPTGYPGMILLSLLPPLWFSVMHNALRNHQIFSAPK